MVGLEYENAKEWTELNINGISKKAWKLARRNSSKFIDFKQKAIQIYDETFSKMNKTSLENEQKFLKIFTKRELLYKKKTFYPCENGLVVGKLLASRCSFC